jgi:hypothetical protein
LLYVKVRSELPGFWGLTANRVNELNRSGNTWYAVLVLGSPSKGYVVTSKDVMSRINSGAWTLSGDGDYKINERTDLDGKWRFGSIEKLVECFLS